MIAGSPGFGKTRLLHELRTRLTAENIRSLYLPFTTPLHTFLVAVAARLSLRSANDSSVTLRGLLWKELESNPRILLLDDISEAILPFYRFFEKLLYVEGITIIGTAVHVRAVGTLQRIFWNHQTVVTLRPLTKQGALFLTQRATALFAPDLFGDADFQRRVVHVARGNPGRIIEMCTRAASPAYRDGDRIRFAALSIDSLTRLLP